MGDDKNKTPLVPISGVLVILAALGITIFGQPYKGARPPAPEYRECHSKVNARLWQDPFQAVLDGAKGREGLTPCEFDIASDSVRDQSTETCPASIGAGEAGSKLMVLGVMVPGAPYVEDGEKRMRYRYAVLSGLGRLGYVPEDPEHIEFIKIQDGGKSQSPSMLGVMPLERLVRSRTGGERNRILVLWMNDGLFQKEPLKKIDQLGKYLGPLYEMSDVFRIIGPARSDTLREMVKEAGDPSCNETHDATGPQKYQIYSALTTVDDRTLLREALNEEPPLASAAASERIRARLRLKGFGWVRTIGSDRDLADRLIDELKLRNANVMDDKARILLVAEWDTLYGRSFEEALWEDLVEAKIRGGSSRAGGGDKAGISDAFGRVLRVSYLRGIDGRLPGEDDKKDGQKDEKAEAKGDFSKTGKKMEQPVGKSQYDYLRRLSDRVERLNDDLKREGKGQIKAIGVMGTDFYDKYLVLQALRQKLPAVIYFTTDLDARFLHPDNIEWTRNLVVASNFDFSLIHDLQGGIPPFRDSYQTALFFTVLKAFGQEICRRGTQRCEAVHERFEKFDRFHAPMIFEIGQRSAVLLTKPGETIHPLTSRPYRISRTVIVTSIVLVVVASTFLLLTSTTVNRYFKWVVLEPGTRFSRISARLWPVMVLVATVPLIYWVSDVETEEPFSIFEGISVWPTEILRIAAIVLSWAFFYRAFHLRRKSTDEIIVQFHFEGVNTEQISRSFFADGLKNLTSFSAWKWAKITAWVSNVLDLGWKPEGREGYDLKNLWQEYRDHDKGRYRFWRVTLIAVLYMGLCGGIISFFDPPVSPVRGPISWWVDWAVLRLCVVSFALLVSYVFDVTTFCRRFISIASEGFSKKDDPFNSSDTGKRIKDARDLIHLITVRTAVIQKLIFYPFIVWLIMCASRFTYIDNWRTSVGLAAVLSLGALFAWASALLLRLEAEKARSLTVGWLKGAQAKALFGEQPPELNTIRRLANAIREIKSVREGAFAPLSQHPVLHVLFVAFGGLGGMFSLDLLSKLNF